VANKVGDEIFATGRTVLRKRLYDKTTKLSINVNKYKYLFRMHRGLKNYILKKA
jgi:hypothetical protein